MTHEEMLEQLAEFQAQADLLELQRQELIDAVKVPDEVLATQKEANERRQKLDAYFWERQNAIREEESATLDLVKEPELPPEYIAAFEAARKQQLEIQKRFAAEAEKERLAVIEAKTRIDTDLQAQIAEVYNQVAIRKQEINDEFSEKASGVLDNIAKLTADVKAEVIKIGKSVKGSVYQAVFVKGRVTWNTDMLDGMIIAYPELGKARKEGQPSVTLRKN